MTTGLLAETAGSAKENAGGQSRLDGIHGLRATAALAVVIFHSGGSIGSEKYQGIEWVAGATRWLDVGVDLFFVISGFVISLPLFLGRARRLDSYLLHRLLRIYPMALLTAAIFAISNWLVFARVPEFGDFLSSFLLLPSAIEPKPVVLWTLKQELLFYAIFSITFFRPVVGIWILFAWAIASLFIGGGASPYLKWLFHPMNAEFAFGVLASYLFVKVPLDINKAVPTACAALIALGASSFAADAMEIPRNVESIILGFFSAVAVYGLAISKIQLPFAVMLLGTASYAIYLIHFYFISLGNKALVRLLPELPGPLALVFLAGFAAMMGCAYYLVFERSLEHWRKSLK